MTTRTPYSDSELEIAGYYLPKTQGETDTIVSKLNTPITPRKNLQMILNGEKPYWFPRSFIDYTMFRPRISEDTIACQVVQDGGPSMDYKSVYHKGWFDVEWEYVPQAMGATVRPGQPMISDIDEWESIIEFPDLDQLDWAGQAEMSKDFLNQDRLNVASMLCGLWERLISLMDVEGAAIALIDEDQKDGVHSFFNRLCDFYDDYIGRLKTYFDIDVLHVHDDWGHQQGTFFSEATFCEMILPYVKRLVKSCHDRGIFYMQHSCGKIDSLIPWLIEAGVDIWEGQEINDLDAIAKQYSDKNFLLYAKTPAPPDDCSEAELEEIARKFVEEHKDHKVLVNSKAPNMNRLYPYIYKYSRLAHENEPA